MSDSICDPLTRNSANKFFGILRYIVFKNVDSADYFGV